MVKITPALEAFIKEEMREINANLWHFIIKDLSYNYNLSQDIYESYNSLFLIFKECGIRIPDDMIKDTLNKLGFDDNNCIVVPLYNKIKGEDISESLIIVNEYMKKTVKDYYINSSKNETCLADIVYELQEILGHNIDTFKEPNFIANKNKIITEPVTVRIGYELQVDGEYILLRVDLDNGNVQIISYEDNFGFFIPGFGFAYNTNLLKSYVEKILRQLN